MTERYLTCALLAAVLIVPLPMQAAEQDLETALELYKNKEYREAETLLRGIVSDDPENAHARYLLGMTLLELKNYPEAEGCFRKADELTPRSDEKATPRSDEIQVGLSRALMEQKKLEQSAEALKLAESLRPKNPDVYFYRGVLDAHRKDYAAASRSMEKALELDPTNAYAHYYAGVAYNFIKRPDKMVQHFQAFLKLAPDAPEAPQVRSILRTIR